MQTVGRSAPSQEPTRTRLTGDEAWTILDRNRTSSSKSLVSMLHAVYRLPETIETFLKACVGMAERLS